MVIETLPKPDPATDTLNVIIDVLNDVAANMRAEPDAGWPLNIWLMDALTKAGNNGAAIDGRWLDAAHTTDWEVIPAPVDMLAAALVNLVEGMAVANITRA